MARARDFNGSANETVVVSPKDVKGKVKDSILGKKARLWLLTINNPQNHGISLEQQEILEQLKEDIASGAVTYVSSVMEQSLTTDENGKHTPHGHIAVYYPPQTHGGHLQKIFPMQAFYPSGSICSKTQLVNGIKPTRKNLARSSRTQKPTSGSGGYFQMASEKRLIVQRQRRLAKMCCKLSVMAKVMLKS